jgi:hypothetical protein
MGFVAYRTASALAPERKKRAGAFAERAGGFEFELNS